jgi:cation:H+ antiporter
MPEDLLTTLQLLAGVACAAVGGELFVRGAVTLSERLRVPAAVIGTTIAAFATSAPELSVGVQAALAGQPEIALGNALGANVINVTFVLGIVLTGGALKARRRELRRELGVAMAAPLLTLLALIDGTLVRAEAIVLLAVFVGWLVAVTRHAMRRRIATDTTGEGNLGSGWTTAAAIVGGLVLLVLSGSLIVDSAEAIGLRIGLDPFTVGAAIVAFGTTAPELATALISRRHGHAEIGVGTVLGSNVFNNLWIVGIVAVIQPIRTDAREVLVAVVAGIAALVLILPDQQGRVVRSRGPILLVLGASYAVLSVLLGR